MTEPKRKRRIFRKRVRPARKKDIRLPVESAPGWEVTLAWFLKMMILVTIFIEFIFGEFLYGLWGLVAFGIIFLPVQFAKSAKTVLPVEFEIILLVILSLDVVFGRFLHLYDTLAYYDKIIHYHDSILIAFSGFLLVYSLYFTGRIRVSPLLAGFVIVLVTVGFGGLWEIVEYTADNIFHEGAQGSETMTAIDDTMWDLICDFLGGIMGAVFGTVYIRYSHRTHRRRFYKLMTTLAGEPADREGE
ncbi:MAG: hypothetical protein PHE84_05735 [bacterium]|nr:hypothetical protein [bacterium]